MRLKIIIFFTSHSIFHISHQLKLSRKLIGCASRFFKCVSSSLSCSLDQGHGPTLNQSYFKSLSEAPSSFGQRKKSKDMVRETAASAVGGGIPSQECLEHNPSKISLYTYLPSRGAAHWQDISAKPLGITSDRSRLQDSRNVDR